MSSWRVKGVIYNSVFPPLRLPLLSPFLPPLPFYSSLPISPPLPLPFLILTLPLQRRTKHNAVSSASEPVLFVITKDKLQVFFVFCHCIVDTGAPSFFVCFFYCKLVIIMGLLNGRRSCTRVIFVRVTSR